MDYKIALTPGLMCALNLLFAKRFLDIKEAASSLSFLNMTQDAISTCVTVFNVVSDDEKPVMS